MGTLNVEMDNGVLEITITRPEVRNAIDLATAHAIEGALDELDARDDLLVGVITGEGVTFSAGMDLKALAATGERPVTEGRGPFGLCERPPRKPLIAAVEGAAFGGGFEIALACDLIVAAETAQFALPEVKRGLVAGGGGALRLPRRLPRNVAAELLLTGEPMPAARATEFGLVNRLCVAGQALACARELARAIAGNAPLAVAASKELINISALWGVEEMFMRQHPLVQAVRDSADAQEGTRAFVEKRLPIWQGK